MVPYKATGRAEIAAYILRLAIYTGVARINGQKWIQDIDYSESVDIQLVYPSNFAGHVVETVIAERDDHKARLQVCDASSVALCSPGESATMFAHAMADVEAAQPLIEALAALEDSLSAVFEVRQVLSTAVQLVCEFDKDFVYHFQELLPLCLPPGYTPPKEEDSIVYNNLQISIKTTQEFRGVSFGFEFFCALERCFRESMYELASEFVAENVHLKESQLVMDFRTGVREADERELGNDIYAFEDYIDDLVKKKGSFTFDHFRSSVVNGSGEFCSAGHYPDISLLINAVAVDFKVTELDFNLEERVIGIPDRPPDDSDDEDD
ncbi:UNVERIFIED_CONTAM: hypothetical protein HDU68_001350 [Siphonaria sp. JEL0065]|nr:hypothetical protein HDU68_001350 [Siphonaria sp. JEL0065]